MTDDRRQKRTLFLISVGLVLATLVAYEPIRHNDFVSYDDDEYITNNPNIKKGITWDSVIWAFTTPHFYMWHPLTTLSHILDCQLFGLNPLGHHLVNLIIHIINALLLFWILSNITGSTWASAFVAAAFALHPIQVESAAWAAERKTVLSGLFWFLTIAAYTLYARRPGIGRYILLFGIYGLCIMTKPVVVTLPFVLLLLDYWPLNRFQISDCRFSISNWQSAIGNRQFLRLLYEKIPLLVLSAICSIITVAAQKQSHAVASLTDWPVHMRVINALGNYFNYTVKILYPKGLAALYPLPLTEKMTIDAALLAVMGVVILLVLWGRGRPWLVVGLLWYLGTLVPVLGLVQSGMQSMADRYAYLPSIGLFIVLAWGAKEVFSKIRYSKLMIASGTAAVLTAMILLTRIQVGYWRDSGTLYKRAIDVTKNNVVMLTYYGYYLSKQGKHEEGMRYLKEADRIRPDVILVREQIGMVLVAQNKSDEAISYITETLQKADNWPRTYILYVCLGLAYEQKGNLPMAEMNYKKALELKHDSTAAQKGLASVQAKQRQKTDAPASP
jgi:tetratricopeptide (TPR) repeat protein